MQLPGYQSPITDETKILLYIYPAQCCLRSQYKIDEICSVSLFYIIPIKLYTNYNYFFFSTI